MDTFLYVGIVIAFLSSAFVLFWLSNRNSLVTNWPLIGMIPTLLYNISHIHDFATDFLDKSKGTFFFKGPWFCGMDFLVTCDPLNVHHTFNKHFSNYPKGPEFNDSFGYLGESIFIVDSDRWRVQRNMIHSLFKDKRFELAISTSLKRKISTGLFPVLDHACELGNELDFKDLFQRFTFDNFCVLVFGMDPNTLSKEFPDAPFEKAFDDITQVFFYRHVVPSFVWKLQRWLQIGEEKKMAEASRIFDHFVESSIKRKQEQLQKGENVGEFDAITYFMEVNDENGKASKPSNKFLRDMGLTLLAAGRDSTGAALSWTFWLIGTNPSVQKKILEEMEQHFGCNNGDKWSFFNHEKIRKLVYLHAVICEVLRLYPPLPIERKVSLQQDVLPSGHKISKNTMILYLLYSMGRMKELWGEDCLEFKPERWISERGEIIHQPSHKFIAFNTGPRTCVGKDMGLLQMKAIVCAVLWNYSVECRKDQNIRPACSIIMHQRNGVKVKVSKRRAFHGDLD